MDEVETLLASQQEGTILTADAFSKVAMMAVMMGDEQRVARYYPKLVAFQGRYIDFLIDRILGEMETLLGAWSQAQDHLSRAEAMARREGVVPELARTLSAQGKLALAHGGRGSVTRARTLFGQAHALFEELDMQAEAQRLSEHLEHLPGKSPARHSRALPAGLSAREVEVLRLIVAGKSNRSCWPGFCLPCQSCSTRAMPTRKPCCVPRGCPSIRRLPFQQSSAFLAWWASTIG